MESQGTHYDETTPCMRAVLSNGLTSKVHRTCYVDQEHFGKCVRMHALGSSMGATDVASKRPPSVVYHLVVITAVVAACKVLGIV